LYITFVCDIYYSLRNSGYKKIVFIDPISISPFGKGGVRGILQIISLRNLPYPLFAKEGDTE
jgi:hypothetical protein